jgi:predicted nuclease of predicted toxin-antitoxin system
MKVLLDENLPEELKPDLRSHEVYTVREMNWKGKKNGVLMMLLDQEKFDVLLTADKNLRHQQNFAKYSVIILLLDIRQNTYPAIQKIIPRILQVFRAKLTQKITIIEE